MSVTLFDWVVGYECCSLYDWVVVYYRCAVFDLCLVVQAALPQCGPDHAVPGAVDEGQAPGDSADEPHGAAETRQRQRAVGPAAALWTVIAKVFLLFVMRNSCRCRFLIGQRNRTQTGTLRTRSRLAEHLQLLCSYS